ncbi:hypothetical protein [Streptomyces xantholiticus]|uniref:hypothetical protein n=1 Tax=Streptomyces xantholiticus TaxID=68285 RepID=UPI001676384C|nr:hypothetical protein [Streptomyces xantholiticus]GGW67492.1 hypothetical protein GCM10010381_60570 [Streptomyces xantholiticus]
MATPEGWRHSILMVEGGMLCGRLSDGLLEPEAALAAAATTLKKLARDFHDTTVEVTWDRQEPWAWTGRVVPVAEPAPTEGRRYTASSGRESGPYGMLNA